MPRTWPQLTTLDKTVIREPVWCHQNVELDICVAKRSGCYLAILKPIKQQLDAMLSHYSKVLMVRLDLHVCEYSGDNKKISYLMKKLKKSLNQKYGMKHVGYSWVRELETSDRQHYHLALLLNGHKIRYPQKIIKWIEQFWQNRGEPKPFTPKNCYTMIYWGDHESYKKAFFRMSYFAKERGKGHKDLAANNYSTSRLSCSNSDRRNTT